jgi:hypothetical protein
MVTPMGTPASSKPMKGDRRTGTEWRCGAEQTGETIGWRLAFARQHPAHPLRRQHAAQHADSKNDDGQQHENLGDVLDEEVDGVTELTVRRQLEEGKGDPIGQASKDDEHGFRLQKSGDAVPRRARRHPLQSLNISSVEFIARDALHSSGHGVPDPLGGIGGNGVKNPLGIPAVLDQAGVTK